MRGFNVGIGGEGKGENVGDYVGVVFGHLTVVLFGR